MYDNKEKEIEIGIPQGLPILSIFFIIYITRVFDIVKNNNLVITSLLFVDNLKFIAFSNSIKEIS